MRIVHTCLRYPPALGGAENYIKDIVTQTRDIKKGRDVRVLSSQLKTHSPISTLDNKSLSQDPIYLQRLHHLKFPFISYPWLQSLPYYLKHHQPDILHSYGFWYQPADITARFAVKHKLPFIFHPIFYENSVRRKPIWQIYKKTIGQKTFAAASVVVVISPQEQRLITKNNFPVKKFALIPPGIDMDKFSKPTHNFYQSQNIKGKIILSVGRLAHSKGLDDVIDILPSLIKNHPDLHYAIIGEDFGYQKNLQDKVTHLGLTNHVHFLGKINPQQLISAYQHADILAHPSHYEAFGIVLAESLAAGTPVVARHCSSIPYVCPHNIGGLLFSSRPELLKSLDHLLKNISMQKKYGALGRQYVRDNFDSPKTIGSIISLYNSLL
jgi:glycosyltransferase involved in cell wall biosynthesis